MSEGPEVDRVPVEVAAADPPFRRRVLLAQPRPGIVEASIEDHIHHFSVVVTHERGSVVAVEGDAIRAPWDLCPGAIEVLTDLVGSPIGVLPRVGDPSAHCTHLLDVAATAIRFAGHSAVERRIDLEVVGWATPRSTARAVRHDGPALRWTVEGDLVVEPEPFTGRRLGRGFTDFVAGLDPETAELALLLRRATRMCRSRSIDLDRFDVLAESGLIPGSCFASQPDRIGVARRNRGSTLPELR